MRWTLRCSDNILDAFPIGLRTTTAGRHGRASQNESCRLRDVQSAEVTGAVTFLPSERESH
jgi:hypothetical protein